MQADRWGGTRQAALIIVEKTAATAAAAAVRETMTVLAIGVGNTTTTHCGNLSRHTAAERLLE